NFAAGSFDSLGFYYDELAEKRLCASVLLASPSDQSIIMKRQAWKWWDKRGKVPDRIDPFPAGARAAGAFWHPVDRPPGPGPIPIDLVVRSASGVITPK